ALYLRKQGLHPLLVAADVYRPAAIDQLVTLGKGLNIPVYAEDPQNNPVDIAERGLQHARQNGASVVIVDTAGRLHIDDDMMDEVATIRMRVDPTEVILVADAMTGQDAVRVAEEFNARVPLSGMILTKIDGDARGGAALSIRAVTGIPLKFLATGEKPDALEPFYPDRLASRILGMGDMLSLIERAEQTMDQSQGEAMDKKLRTGSFDLDDFLKQLQQIKKMGPLTQIIGMIPGMRNLTKGADLSQIDDNQIKRVEAIISSMTLQERRDPNVLNASRRRRIATGSGTSVQELNALLSQFKQMQKMMKQFSKAYRVPGGALRRDEAMDVGALREAREETGLDAVARRYLLRINVRFTRGDDGVDWTTHVLAATTDQTAIDPIDTREIREARWSTLAELNGPIRAILLASGSPLFRYRSDVHRWAAEELSKN
ncbi:MAG: NUDIX domain-containing protein, partial [Chloroflexi bacterium]|nr:NUDIX domain-containing protein [Chloroflexota bacterium]